jgi:hypothetical protein
MTCRREFLLTVGTAAMAGIADESARGNEPFQQVPLHVHSDAVSPWTGIVLWDTNQRAATDAIQLEYSYMKYADVIRGRDKYDWDVVEQKLAAIASRKRVISGIHRDEKTRTIYFGSRSASPCRIR